METRHPVEDPFHLVMNFRRSKIVAELWRPKVGRRWKFSRKVYIFWKTTRYGEIFKFCSERIHRDTDLPVVFKFCEIWPTENR